MTESLSEYEIVYIVIFLVLIYIFYYGGININYKSLSGPWGLPVVGYLPWLGARPHLTLSRLAKEYGNIYKISLGRKTVIVLNGQAMIRDALVHYAIEFADRPDLFHLKFMRKQGQGVLTSHYGPEFKLRRKIMIRALAKFANREATDFHEILYQAIDHLVKILKETNGVPYNPKEDIKQAVGKIISTLCFGKEFLEYESDYKFLMKNLSVFNRTANPKNILTYLPWLKIFFQKKVKDFYKFETTFYNMCSNLLKPRSDSKNQNNVRDIADAIIKSAEEIKNSNKVIVNISDNDMKMMIRELLGAGFATVASTIHWGILYMSLYPEIQKKVQKELDLIIAENVYPCLNDEAKLIFTQATILEIHRFASIVPLGVSRATTEKIVFKGYFIPEGTMVIANFSSAHMDPEIWNKPHTFNPLRFLNEDQSSLDSAKAESIMPFGAGRRRCAGEILARMELFVIFATLMQQFDFQNVCGKSLDINNYEAGFLLIPDDFIIKITSRK